MGKGLGLLLSCLQGQLTYIPTTGSALVCFPGEVRACGEGWVSTEHSLAAGVTDTTPEDGCILRAMDLGLDLGSS